MKNLSKISGKINTHLKSIKKKQLKISILNSRKIFDLPEFNENIPSEIW